MTEAFFGGIRDLFGGRFTQPQVDGLNHLLKATYGKALTHRAYILATAFHETAKTMQPIAEYGKGKGRAYGQKDATGKAPYGRGYVQLTWRENYLRADRELGLGGALASDYDVALQPEVAAKILVEGMSEGWFTGKSLSDFRERDYVGMRRIVNGTDRANMIAGYAATFERALEADRDAPAEAVAPAAPKASPVAALIAAILKVLEWLTKGRR